MKWECLGFKVLWNFKIDIKRSTIASNIHLSCNDCIHRNTILDSTFLNKIKLRMEIGICHRDNNPTKENASFHFLYFQHDYFLRIRILFKQFRRSICLRMFAGNKSLEVLMFFFCQILSIPVPLIHFVRLSLRTCFQFIFLLFDFNFMSFERNKEHKLNIRLSFATNHPWCISQNLLQDLVFSYPFFSIFWVFIFFTYYAYELC